MDVREREFTVDSIATPARVETRASYADAVADFESRSYTYMPLPETGEYYNVEEGWFRDLRPEQEVGPDEHLLDALELLREEPFLLVDYRAAGADHDYGIVTLADVNGRGTHEMIYPVIAELTSLVADRIRASYDSRELFDRLTDRTVGSWIKDEADGVELHVAESMDLGEMQQVLEGSPERLAKSCGFASKEELDDLDAIRDLRNRVMHANRSLVRERRQIGQLLETLDRAQELVRRANSGAAFE